VILAHSLAPSVFICIVTIGADVDGSIFACASTTTPPVNSGFLFNMYSLKYDLPSGVISGLASYTNSALSGRIDCISGLSKNALNFPLLPSSTTRSAIRPCGSIG